MHIKPVDIKGVNNKLKLSEEQRFLDAAPEEGEPDMPMVWEPFAGSYERQQRKNRSTINSFLGKGSRVNAVAIVPRYYGELLTWSLHRYIVKNQWKTITLNYPEPVYIDVSTDYDKRENLLMNGQLLVEKENCRLVVTVEVNPKWRGSVKVEGLARQKKEVQDFIDGINAIGDQENIYRNKKIEFGVRLRFLDIRPKSWESIILGSGIKNEIRDNTVNFLHKKEVWNKHGIPMKRGILLAGEPGTGKTIICKALMDEAESITCIMTNAYGLGEEDYITELYDLACDLSPCIVFIEDIDLIGQNREEFNYRSGPALLALLAVLDGVEEKEGIVTVATTNNLETLDKAIRQRPSRFDCVIKLGLPSLEERKELVSLLCRKIPVDKSSQDYIAHEAEHCTPAQLQEIIFSLAIQHSDELLEPHSTYLNLSKGDIETVISKINGRNNHQIGFTFQSNHNGGKPDLIGTEKLIH